MSGPSNALVPGALPPTFSVPEFGRRFLALGRDASYDAAGRGEIVTAKFGRSVRALTWPNLRRLGYPDEEIAKAMRLDTSESTDGESPAKASSSNVHPLAPAMTTGDKPHGDPAA